MTRTAGFSQKITVLIGVGFVACCVAWAAPEAVVFSPDGKQVAVGGQDSSDALSHTSRVSDLR